ncbi:MAG: divergent polysaccharide deacetylase family protein [Treponema sp.]|nr:divergent polysaccharide deacetylase family protein [Treponema sp.]
MTAQKKRVTKKTPSKKTGTAKKRTSARKSSVKKGKVSVSATGLFALCGGVIVCCMVLLLATTIAEKRPEIDSSYSYSAENDHAAKVKPAQPEKKKQAASAEKKAEPKKTAEKNISQKTKTEPKPQVQEKVKSDASGIAAKTPQPEAQAKPKPREELKQEPAPKPANEVKQADGGRPKTENKKADFNFPQASNNAQLCILLDDGGQNLDDLKKFLALKIPVTVAVLPKLRDSVSSAQAVRASGYAELMLHQPMQAVNLNVNPGPGAIKPDMTSSQITNLVLENLREVGPVSGMNNHEGSLITADAEKMETVINLAHMQGIYFLDSRTNVETKIPYVSRELGYGWYERNGYFLDNQKTREEFLKELRKNLDIANKTGCVIMIAHVWSADYMPALIREVYPELVAKGYSFTTVGKSKGLKN